MSEPVRVRLWVEAGRATYEDTQEIDRAEWDAMTEQQRQKLLEDMYEIHLSNHVGGGWEVEGTDS